MFGRSFESILSECVDAMRSGASIDDCLARYPKQARRLRPQLAMAAQISRTPISVARPEAQARAWHDLQRRATELRTGRVRPRVSRAVGGSLVWLKPVAFTAVVVASISAAGGGLLYAAQDASPDSSLYTVKLTGENVHVWFTFDDASKANVLLDQSEQRMEEINTAVADGQPVPESALSDMHDRNQRAAEILIGQPENTVLRERVTTQAEMQEQRLLALWPQVSTDDRETYAQVVANLHNTQLGGGIAVANFSLRPEALSGGILTISGLAELGEDGVWRVGGFEVRIDERTLGQGDVRAGSRANILAAKSSNGQLQALTANVQNVVLPTAVVGEVEKITDEGITVGGQFIPFSDDTFSLGELKVGEKVQVNLHSTTNGLVAGSINQFGGSGSGQPQTFWIEGSIEGDISKSTNQWSVGGMLFQIASNAIDASAGSAGNGSRVHIEALNDNGTFKAQRVTVLASQATADSVNLLGTFDGYDDDEEVWKISGISVAPPTNATEADDPPIGSLVFVEARRQGNGLIATGIETVEEPDGPNLVQLEGTILAIDGSRWTLEYGQVRVASTSRVRGEPDVGKRVIVWAIQGRDGLDATYTRVLDQSPVVTPAPAVIPAPAP